MPLQAPLQTRFEKYRRRPGAAQKTLVKSPVKQDLLRGQETVELVRLWAGCAEYFADQYALCVPSGCATQGHWHLSALLTPVNRYLSQTDAEAHKASVQVLQAWIQPNAPGALAPRELEDAYQNKVGTLWRKGDRKYFCDMKPIYWEMERRQRATGMADAAVMHEMDIEAKDLKLSPHQYAIQTGKCPDYIDFAKAKRAEYEDYKSNGSNRRSSAKQSSAE